MPSTHPITMLLGMIGLVSIIAMTVLGIMCSAYNNSPEKYPEFLFYRDLAKACKLC